MSMRRHDPPKEVDEVGREERVSGQIFKPESLPLHDLDFIETHVVELLEKHWLRQRARESARERGRALEHVLWQCLVKDQVRNADPPSRPQNA